jgi:uncharacterized protein YcfJ
VLGVALIAGAVSSAHAGDRYAERWSRSAYEYRYGNDRQRYDDRRVQRRPVVIERTIERRVVVRPPVREVIVERPVYVEHPGVYRHDPYAYGHAPGRAHVSPGTVGGAIVGAIIGSQVGHGPNRAATAAAGAVIGGVIGSRW